MPVSIQELVGFAKTSSDLESRPMRIRYNESQIIQSGQYFRLTFPRVADDLLDLRSIKMRFTLNLLGAGADMAVDASSISCLVNRLRCLSGSQVLMDISEASTLLQLERNVETATHDNRYVRYLEGSENLATRQAYPRSREYVCDIAPIGSLLNCDAVLPLSKLSSLHLEVWLETPQRVLFSPDGSGDYSLSGVELLCNYIRSPSISAYFVSNQLSFHIRDYSHRLNIIQSSQALCRFSSAHTSLNKIVTLLRPQSQVSGITTSGKLDTTYSGVNISSYNLHVNNSLYYEEAVDSNEQSFTHFLSSFPQLATSEHFDTGYNTTKHLICVDMSAAPPAFQAEISSGKKTSSLNSDIVLKLDLTATPAETIRADSYLMSDALVYLDGQKGDLKIKY